MGTENNGSRGLHSASEGGVAGTHSSPALREDLLVAPSTSSELNTVRLRLIPIACWQVDDIRFAFDSSFVTSDVATELRSLVTLREAHKQTEAITLKTQYPPLSVFGHADPVGTDDYNKALSGRRASAIYAVLICNTNAAMATKLWQEIAQTEKWGDDQRQAMQSATGLQAGASMSDLINAYLKTVCPQELQLTTKDFLAQGLDAGGKGDYQGCSEFNPKLIFSQQEEDGFEGASDNAARNRANAENRRVTVLLFRPGSLVLASKWPCPRAKEGKAGCIKRFWSNGEDRRSRRLPDQVRHFGETHDTFACRFYHRLTVDSPCERKTITFEIRLYTPIGLFIASAPYRLSIGGSEPRTDQADAKGVVVVKDVEVPNQCSIQWGYPPENGKEPDLIFTLSMFLEADAQEQQTEATQKLHNLGYPDDEDFSTNVASFQRDYGQLANPALTVTGQLNNETFQLIRDVYRSSEDDLRNEKPQSTATS